MLKFKALSASLMAILVAGFTLGDEGVPNWPAPATWSPHSASRGVSTMASITSPLPFIGVTPCRVADTRGNGFTGQYGPPALVANATRSFTIVGQCSIPASAVAVSFNFGALNVGAAGDLRVFPAGGGVPLASTLNYNGNTPDIANAAVVSLGTGGAITVQADAVPLDLIIDVNGYYSPQGIVNSLNSLFGNITLSAVTDLTLTPNGQTLAISANSTSNDEPDTLVRRDGSRSFRVGTVTLSGNLILPFPNSPTQGTVFQGSTRFLYTLGSSSASVFLGPAAGNFTITGTSNTAIGDSALSSDSGGSGNTAIGNGVLFQNTVGHVNTGVGAGALTTNSSGIANTAIGYAALVFNSSGSSNIAIGVGAGGNLTTGSNNIDIFDAGVADESNTIRIGTGGTQTRAFLAGVRGTTTGLNDAVAVMVDSAGQLGTVSSSRCLKQNIEDMGGASQALMKLRPVTFRYKATLDPTGSQQFGLIAEEVGEVFPDLVVSDRDGHPETVRYHLLVPMLLNEFQKDRRTIADLTARLERLEALISEANR